MSKITVYPTKASALNLKHPIDGQLAAGGSQWTQDGFTFRLITDGILTRDPAGAFKAASTALETPATPAAADAAAKK